MTELIDPKALKQYIDDCKVCDHCPDKNMRCYDGCELPDFLTKQWERIIDEQPIIEAEPVRHAHWIWKGDEGDSRFMCSACGVKENAPTCMGVPNIWEYCPNCGARMEEYELERKRTDTETD